MWSGAFGVSGFIQAHAGGRRVHSRRFVSFGFALDVIVLIRDLRVHTGSLGTFGYSLGVVGFIRGSWVHYSAPRV